MPSTPPALAGARCRSPDGRRRANPDPDRVPAAARDAERRPEALPDRKGESFRHDSDHSRLCCSEPHDTTYHRRIRAESHLPETIPQNDDRGRSRRLVLIHENAPDQRGNASNAKTSSADLGGVDRLAHLIAHDQVLLDRPERADILEGAKSFPPVEDVVCTRAVECQTLPGASSSARRCDLRAGAAATDSLHAG